MAFGKRPEKCATCGSTPPKRQRTQDFQYENLMPGYIRILQVTQEVKGRSARRYLSTYLRPFHVEHLPHFVALSYAWAQAGGSTQTLSCNGRLITVSDHVYTALENLFHDKADASFAIWIDAICIDQKNDNEKSKQVPHMGSVYSLASQVVIWLGPNDLVDQHRRRIEQLAAHVESLSEAPSKAELHEPPFPDQGDEVCIALGSMLSSSWFRRLWIVQELCLGKHVNVLSGHCLITWDSMGVLMRRAVHGSWDKGTEFQALDACRVSLKHNDTNQFMHVLDTLRLQLATKPIDKVYGLLFMLPDVLRNQIKVDYTLEREYWKPYVQLAFLLLQQPIGLLVLSTAPSTGRPAGLPSWCPDWNAASTWRALPTIDDQKNGCGGPLEPLKSPQVRLEIESSHIQVLGFRIDQIFCTIPFQCPEGRWGVQHKQNWNAWQHECLQQLLNMKADTSQTQLLLTHMRNLRINFWEVAKPGEDFGTSTTVSEETWPEIKLSYDEALPSDATTRKLAASYDPNIPRFLDIDGLMEVDRTYIFTEQGRVGRGCTGDRTGDILVVLYTAPALFVLRYEEGSNVATLIGEAYLEGCMDLDTMPSEGRGPDEWFIIG
jgi:hypothetical protein